MSRRPLNRLPLKAGTRLLAVAAITLAATAASAAPADNTPAGNTHPAAPPAIAASGTPAADDSTSASPPPGTRNGHDIYQAFNDGLANPGCEADVSARWSRHYAAAPKRLARRDETLALFGYVVDAVREAHLPTEYALIPFIESGYKPGARNPQGPAGLWQMIEMTARAHKVPIRPGFDGRLSPVESTRAAVRYLKTLHGMFAGDWRLAVMAYNAGEYRILRALERGGQVARDARPQDLPGLSGITYAYVRKLQALSCLMQQADQREAWRAALDRPVPRLQALTLPTGTERIDAWAAKTGHDPERLRRLNPVFVDGRVARDGDRPVRVLAAARPQMGAVETAAATASASASAAATAPAVVADTDAGTDATPPRRHTVERGDNLWTLARHYGVRVDELRQRNGLDAGSVLKPGVVLVIDAPTAAAP